MFISKLNNLTNSSGLDKSKYIDLVKGQLFYKKSAKLYYIIGRGNVAKDTKSRRSQSRILKSILSSQDPKISNLAQQIVLYNLVNDIQKQPELVDYTKGKGRRSISSQIFELQAFQKGQYILIDYILLDLQAYIRAKLFIDLQSEIIEILYISKKPLKTNESSKLVVLP